MRQTQFIGLTHRAMEFVKDLEKIKEDKDNPTNFATGMFGEKLPLRTWTREGEYKTEIIREVVQDVPWSSGPMIFTMLEIDFGNGGKVEAFQWVVDPTVTNEFCYETGRYWI